MDPRWLACRTRARHEKRVEELMRGRGLESYLPLMRVVRQWSDRRKIVLLPLFPGYLFVRVPTRDVRRVLAVPGVASVVCAGTEPAVIPDDDIENVRRFAAALAESGLSARPVPCFSEGQLVRVSDGPFRGVTGQVIERRGRRRVLIGIHEIGHALEVDMPVHNLELVAAG
jgi:transcription antitermination factor NusG